MTQPFPAAGAYLERAAAMRAEAERLRRAHQRLGAARLAVFAIVVVAAAGAIAYAEWRTAWVTVAAIAAVSFARLLAASERLTAARSQALTTAAVNEQSAARMEREWDGIPLPAVASLPSDDDPLQSDLAIFGPRSLAHLLPPSRVHTARRSCARGSPNRHLPT
jgi:hypothetical protein